MMSHRRTGGSNILQVFFATNRGILAEGDAPKFSKRFNEKGPHELRYGSAKVRKTKKGYKVSSIYLAPERIETKGGESQVLGSEEICDALRARMVADKVDVICYIHGYASDMDSALERAAEIKDKYKVDGRDPHVFVFSWPADGEMKPWLSYYSDRDDARASGVAIARAFLKLRRFLLGLGREGQCEQSLHLVAHSMGNYALRWAVQGIRSELGHNLPRLFDNVFLMAADEDDDAFEHDHKLRVLPGLAHAVHIYFSPDDRALQISDITKGNPDRLGSQGPRVRDGIPRKVVLVDCRNVDVSDDDLSNHQYYRLNPRVVKDVNLVLKGVAPEKMPTRTYIPEDRSWRVDAKTRTRARTSTRNADRGH
ncbi:MAG: alpha/beta hydrolase [Kiloniellaceae bacterium]